MATIIDGHFARRVDTVELKRLEGRRADAERLLHGLMGNKSSLASRRYCYGKITNLVRPGSPLSIRRSDDEIIADLLDLLALFATLYHERETSRSRM